MASRYPVVWAPRAADDRKTRIDRFTPHRATKSPNRARACFFMPYWSSSRVGAVPQGQPVKPKKRNERNNARKKGITMEDLKKQTAIRLAKEQQQQQGRAGTDFGGSADGTHGVVVPKNRPSTNTSNSSSNYGTPELATRNPQTFPQVTVSTPQESYAATTPQSAPQIRHHHHQQHHATGVVQLTYGVGGYDHHHQQHHGSPMPSSNDDHVSTPVRYVGGGQRFFHSEQLSRSAPRPSTSSSSDAASAGKPKLPHGLTVHELKEMTKARLQAEASEKRDNAEPLGPVPSVIRATQDYRDAHPRASPTGASPVPPTYYGRNNRSPYPDSSFGHHDNRSIDSRNEGWENGSVNTQTSDYFGSEHAFGVASFNGDDHAFNRTRSLSASSTGFTAPHEFSLAQDDYLPQAQSFYSDPNTGFAPNRRRAATLSPRAGLSHLHEDRPVLGGQNLPGLPSFHHHTPGMASRVPPRNRGAFFTPEQHPPPRYYSEEDNRARTLSAVSLPTMSHTAEEFGALPSGSSVTGLSDVFRESPAPVSTAFVGGPDLHVVPAVSSIGLGSIDSYEPRTRASTWGETTTSMNINNTSDLFGPSLIRGQDSELSDDLASILKLSGAEEKDDPLSLSGLM